MYVLLSLDWRKVLLRKRSDCRDEYGRLIIRYAQRYNKNQEDDSVDGFFVGFIYIMSCRRSDGDEETVLCGVVWKYTVYVRRVP